jgi:hypothetical protein
VGHQVTEKNENNCQSRVITGTATLLEELTQASGLKSLNKMIRMTGLRTDECVCKRAERTWVSVPPRCQIHSPHDFSSATGWPESTWNMQSLCSPPTTTAFSRRQGCPVISAQKNFHAIPPLVACPHLSRLLPCTGVQGGLMFLLSKQIQKSSKFIQTNRDTITGIFMQNFECHAQVDVAPRTQKFRREAKGTRNKELTQVMHMRETERMWHEQPS